MILQKCIGCKESYLLTTKRPMFCLAGINAIYFLSKKNQKLLLCI